jgi:hypothetical protein
MSMETDEPPKIDNGAGGSRATNTAYWMNRIVIG